MVSKGVSKHESGVSRWGCAAAVCLPAMVGCTELDFEDDDCSTLGRTPCAVTGGGGSAGNAGNPGGAGTAGTSAMVEAPGWRCLDESPPVHDLPQFPAVIYVVPIVDFANPTIAPQMLDIAICLISDLNCDSPLNADLVAAGLPPISEPDPERPFIHAIPLPYNFQGYLRLTATDYLTTDYHFGGPMIGNPENPDMPSNRITGELIGMPRVGYIDDFFSRLSTQARSKAAGLLALRVLNCDNDRSAGVRLDLTNDVALGWTIRGGQPANDRMNPNDTLATDTLAIAGFANIQAPGNVIVEGLLQGDRRYGEHPWPVSPDTLTLAEIRTDYSYGR